MFHCSLIVSILFAVALATPVALKAQQQGSPPPHFPAGVRAGQIVIDGSKNPERIPDRVAIGMFMSSIAIPAPADIRIVKAMYAKVAPLKLSLRDMGILRTELARLQTKLIAHAETMAAARENLKRLKTPQAAATFTAVAESRDTLAVDSYERVLTALSPGAAEKLRAHINVVKRQMKLIGPAN